MLNMMLFMYGLIEVGIFFFGILLIVLMFKLMNVIVRDVNINLFLNGFIIGLM